MSASPTDQAPPAIDMGALFVAHERERFEMHAEYLNERTVRVLRQAHYDLGFTRGAGPYLYDREGREYLDLQSGYGVFAIGRNHPRVCEALVSVLRAELPNLVQLDVSTLAGLLAQRLLEFAPYLDRVFFANSGTEAIEAAIKFARVATGRASIVSCHNGFHGLTYGSLSLCGIPGFRAGFEPMLADCIAVPFNDLAALERALQGNEVAAFVVEPIQGNGVIVPHDRYLLEAAALCRRHGALFIADEVMTGCGRTGRFLAVEHCNVEPDLAVMAKALSGGHVPIGAVLMRKWVYDKLFATGAHGSTFSKNDLAMAAGIATLDVLSSERLIERAARLGEQLRSAFVQIAKRQPIMADVRGRGMMIGLEFDLPRSLLPSRLINPLLQMHRILVHVTGVLDNTLRLVPPLVIGDEACSRIEAAFKQVVAPDATESVLSE
jgi:ornithine--oxo-acid transaminase